jgi:hypothetical protein
MKQFPVDSHGQYVSNLEGIEIGNKLMYHEGWESDLVVVDCVKVTAKQCVIGRSTYRKSDARRLGDNAYSTYSPSPLRNFDQDEYDKSKQRKQLRIARNKLSNFSWHKCSDDLIAAVWAIVEKDVA